MLIAELAALSAAFCWALSGLISIGAIRKLGPVAFNRARMSLVFLMLAGVSLLTGAWRDFSFGYNSNADDFLTHRYFSRRYGSFRLIAAFGAKSSRSCFCTSCTDDGDYGLVPFE